MCMESHRTERGAQGRSQGQAGRQGERTLHLFFMPGEAEDWQEGTLVLEGLPVAMWHRDYRGAEVTAKRAVRSCCPCPRARWWRHGWIPSMSGWWSLWTFLGLEVGIVVQGRENQEEAEVCGLSGPKPFPLLGSSMGGSCLPLLSIFWRKGRNYSTYFYYFFGVA
jgi:hypothetical protein